jgi:hypothetical protein
VAVIDAQAGSVLALGDHPGLQERAVVEPGDAHATLLREEHDLCVEDGARPDPDDGPVPVRYPALLLNTSTKVVPVPVQPDGRGTIRLW